MGRIKLFENFSPKIIFHLHGLDSQPWPDRVKIMSSGGNTVIAPHVNYREEDVYKMAVQTIEENKPDALVGHSLGGLLLFYLSNQYQIPALFFNPAFKSKNAHLLKVPQEVMDLKPFDKQMAVIGMQDQLILPSNQEAAMKHAIIYKVEELPHTVDPQTFKSYFSLFQENFL